MSQLKAVGAGLAMAGGVAGSVVALLRRGARRRPSAADLMHMNEQAFDAHLRETGMEAQVLDALARIDRGTA